MNNLKKCEYCGKEYIQMNNNQRFCCVKCVQLHNKKRIKVNCIICGQEKEIKRYRKDTFKCCSKKCLTEYIKLWMKKHSKKLSKKLKKGFLKGRVVWNKGKLISQETKDKIRQALKGRLPWNTGTKGVCKSNSGSFKKGQKSLITVPVLTIKTRIRKRDLQARNWIKVTAPNIWIPLARYVWQKSNYLLPKGSIIHHKDFNPLNDNINNLQLVTRKEHIKIHRKGLYSRV